MCSERALRSGLRDGPVDSLRVCHCSLPESVQVILGKIQILSFDYLTIRQESDLPRTRLSRYIPSRSNGPPRAGCVGS